MKVVVDGVIFQHAETGIARMWSAILARMEKYADLHVVLLDRGRAPSFAGVERVEFPSYKANTATAADSFLLDRFCKRLGADVFCSTWYTTPVTIPSVLVLCDVTPDVPGDGPNQRPAQEKQIAINFASYYACLSERARSDLELRYRGTLGRSVVTSNGDWEGMTDCLYQLLGRAHEEGGSTARQEFHRDWARLRAIQAAVDPCRRSDL